MNTLARRSFVQQPARRTPSGAVVCEGYTPPAQPEHQGLTTCKDIVIGGAIPPALPVMSVSAEQLQAALLARQREVQFYDASPVFAVLFGAIGSAGAALAFFWPDAANFFSVGL